MTSALVVKKKALKEKLVGKWLPAMKDIIPQGMTAAKMAAAVTNSFAKTPQLLDCSEVSVVNAVLQCVFLGVYPDTPAQHCHLIPYKGECKLIMGYRGISHLVHRTGEVSLCEARIVYENDHFKIQFGTDPRIDHSPSISDPGKIVGAYAVITKTNGAKSIDWMTLKDLNKVMNAAPGSNKADSPWQKWFEEQCKKTAFKRCSKFTSLESPEVAAAIAIDNSGESLDADPVVLDITAEEIDPTLAEAPSGAGEKVLSKIESRQEPKEEKPPQTTGDDENAPPEQPEELGEAKSKEVKPVSIGSVDDIPSHSFAEVEASLSVAEMRDYVATSYVAISQLLGEPDLSRFVDEVRADHQIKNRFSKMNKGECYRFIVAISSKLKELG